MSAEGDPTITFPQEEAEIVMSRPQEIACPNGAITDRRDTATAAPQDRRQLDHRAL
ncbi:MAG: hypothetical protein AAF280_10675 [Pseudomonadota bacterium]